MSWTKEQAKENSRLWRIKNPEYNKQYAIDHKKEATAYKITYNKPYYIKNKVKILEKSKQYVIIHREEILEKHKQKYIELREKVFDHYGHKCMWPGCDVIESYMLEIDHINGGSYKHYKGIKLYQWLVKNNFPEGFRLLCANHNWEHKINMQKEKWDSKSHSKASERNKKSCIEKKEIIFNNYDHKCNFPGGCKWNIKESDMLHLHHKNNNGAEDRKNLGNKSIYKDIINNNRYSEFLPLCPNCHEKIEKENKSWAL